MVTEMDHQRHALSGPLTGEQPAHLCRLTWPELDHRQAPRVGFDLHWQARAAAAAAAEVVATTALTVTPLG